MDKKIKIIFFGSSDFALPALKLLHDTGYVISAVITVPDQTAGREHVLTPPPAKVKALFLGVKVLQPARLDELFLEEFKSLNPDLCVVASYGKIIPDAYLDIPNHGFLNIHPSLLPKYRGATPIQSAIINGETQTGVTIMKIDEKMDHGEIVSSIKYQVLSDGYYPEIHDELAEIGAKLLIQTIPKYVSGEIKPQPQDHDKATFTKIHSRIDGHLNWADSSQTIYNKIRALNPSPGTWTIWRGALMNIRSAKLGNLELRITDSPYLPGTIIKEGKKIFMMAGDGKPLELNKILLEGKKETTALEFSQGHPDFIGSKFE